MDIALLSMAMSQGQVQQQASLSVMKQALENAEQQGQAVQELISTSNPTAIQHTAQPHLGENIDIKF